MSKVNQVHFFESAILACLLTGCVFGQNQQYFESASEVSSAISTNVPSLPSTGDGSTPSTSANQNNNPLPPVAVNDGPYSISEGTRFSVATTTLLANDSDPNSLSIHLLSVQDASAGSVAISGADVIFVPTATFVGTTQFQYTIANSAGLSASATVTVSVAASVSAVPTPTPPLTIAPIPNPPNNGAGGAQGSNGVGNVLVYGDEWVGRLGDDQNNFASDWAPTMKTNLGSFWNDSLDFVTAPSAHKRVLFARFNSAGTTWDVVPASQWSNYLPNLDPNISVTDYNQATQGPITLSLLSQYDAFIFVSYSPMLTSDLLTQYVSSGGSIMSLVIGFGVPGPSNPDANFECLNMNLILVNFPYHYDCGNPHSNFLATGVYSNLNVSASALPFDNGYAVIPSSQPQTPYQ